MRLDLVVAALIRFLEINGNLFSKPFRILLKTSEVNELRLEEFVKLLVLIAFRSY